MPFVLIALALVATACGSTAETVVESGSSAAADTTAPSEVAEAASEETTAPASAVAEADVLHALTISGESVNVAAPGQDTLLWFWAPW